jgi:hypothetical protein
VVALATAVAMSPHAPIGLSGRAEIHPGVQWHPLRLPAAAAVVVVAVVGRVGTAARLRRVGADRRTAAESAPGLVASQLARWGAGPAAVTGAALAMDRGRGRRAVPGRATFTGAAAGVVAVTTAVNTARLTVSGRSEQLLWITTDHGVVGPTVLAGRLPSSPAEVALASGTMH